MATKNYSQSVYDFAHEWMDECRDTFPAQDFDALVDLLASDIQSALEDFTNPDYREITMNALRRYQKRENERNS